jgi:hypothetical protein
LEEAGLWAIEFTISSAKRRVTLTVEVSRTAPK